LKGLAQNLIVDRTAEGLRIQLVDQDKSPMFAIGSAEPLDSAKKLIAVVTQVVQRLPNKVSISGHTDATAYAFGRKYGNWELSADRANASRREFIGDGLPAERIARVVGLADEDPLVPDEPTSPRNRRISIVLLRVAKDAPPAAASR
jgi:chemotaxis protein MotB